MNHPPVPSSPRKIDFALGLLRVVHELPRPLSIVRLRMILALARNGGSMHGADLARAIGQSDRDPISGHVKNALASGLIRIELIPYGTRRRRRAYQLTEEGTLFARDLLTAAADYASSSTDHHVSATPGGIGRR